MTLMGIETGALAAYAAIASAAVGAGTAVYSATQNKTPKVKDALAPNADAATAAADDLLRKRQRQGVNANILSGVGGAGTPGTSSTGQKSLLGG